jgi:N-hydroxyarylamine O-acetyltransferase
LLVAADLAQLPLHTVAGLLPAHEHGRITLSDRTLIRTTNGQRDERTLSDDAEVLDAYRSHFGIVLDRLPTSPTP